MQQLVHLIRSTASIKITTPRGADRFGDTCQQIVLQDLMIRKTDSPVADNNLKGTHGHDLAFSGKTIECKGLYGFFRKGRANRVKFLRGCNLESDQLAIVIIDHKLGICHISYLPLAYPRSWFTTHPAGKHCLLSVAIILQLEQEGINYYF